MADYRKIATNMVTEKSKDKVHKSKNKKHIRLGDIDLTEKEYAVVQLASVGWTIPQIHRQLEDKGFAMSEVAVRRTLDRIYKKFKLHDPKTKRHYNQQVRLALIYHRLDPTRHHALRELTCVRNFKTDGSSENFFTHRVEVIQTLESETVSWGRSRASPTWDEPPEFEVLEDSHENFPPNCKVKFDLEQFEPRYVKWRIRFFPPIKGPDRIIQYKTRSVTPNIWCKDQLSLDEKWRKMKELNQIFGMRHHFHKQGYAIQESLAEDRVSFTLNFPDNYPVKHPMLFIFNHAQEYDHDISMRLVNDGSFLADGTSIYDLAESQPLSKLTLVSTHPPKGTIVFTWTPVIAAE